MYFDILLGAVPTGVLDIHLPGATRRPKATVVVQPLVAGSKSRYRFSLNGVTVQVMQG